MDGTRLLPKAHKKWSHPQKKEWLKGFIGDLEKKLAREEKVSAFYGACILRVLTNALDVERQVKGLICGVRSKAGKSLTRQHEAGLRRLKTASLEKANRVTVSSLQALRDAQMKGASIATEVHTRLARLRKELAEPKAPANHVLVSLSEFPPLETSQYIALSIPTLKTPSPEVVRRLVPEGDKLVVCYRATAPLLATLLTEASIANLDEKTLMGLLDVSPSGLDCKEFDLLSIILQDLHESSGYAFVVEGLLVQLASITDTFFSSAVSPFTAGRIQKFIHKEGLQRVLKVMAKFPSESLLQKHCCHVLRNICFAYPKSIKTILSGNGVKLVVAALTTHHKIPSIVSDAAIFFCTVLEKQKCYEFMVKEKVMEAFVKGMDLFRDLTVCLNVGNFFALVLSNADRDILSMASGAIDEVCDRFALALLYFSDNEAFVSSAFVIFNYRMRYNDVCGWFDLELVFEIIKAHATNKEIMRLFFPFVSRVSRALRHQRRDPDSVSIDVFDFMNSFNEHLQSFVSALNLHYEDSDLRLYGLRMFYDLCKNDEELLEQIADCESGEQIYFDLFNENFCICQRHDDPHSDRPATPSSTVSFFDEDDEYDDEDDEYDDEDDDYDDENEEDYSNFELTYQMVHELMRQGFYGRASHFFH